MSAKKRAATGEAATGMAEEIATEWSYRDGDPATPEGARHFAAMMKRATGRDVRATFLRDDPKRGVVFAVRDIDREKEAERRATALAEYGKVYAQAVKSGVPATTPDMIDWGAAVDGETIADEADEIENATCRLRAEIEAEKEAQAAYTPTPPDVIEAEERERLKDAYALTREAENAKGKSRKGVSRHAGEKFCLGRYHVDPDGQTITVKGDATRYKITAPSALETLDRLLEGTATEDGWVKWSATDRARFSTPTARSFAKKYIENKIVRRTLEGVYYGQEPKARLKK